jgi:S-adenosylmethionine/arginine decarboxylase-like enzyme
MNLLTLDCERCVTEFTDRLIDVLLDSCEAAGLEVLHHGYYDFGKHGAITAFAVLSESHATVSTWPETKLCCVDLFSCAPNTRWADFIAVWVCALRPAVTKLGFHKRG